MEQQTPRWQMLPTGSGTWTTFGGAGKVTVMVPASRPDADALHPSVPLIIVDWTICM